MSASVEATHSKPENPEADRPAALERFGAWYLRRKSEAAEPNFAPADRHRAVTWLERFVIMRAALAGALSSLLAGGVEIWASVRFGGEDFESRAYFWGVVGGATLAAAVGEIAFLYWDALRSTSRLAKVVGVQTWLGRGDYRDAFARSLARAALELPNTRRPIHGVDPLREASRFALLVASLAYKLKVAASTLLLKLLIRRILSRAALRTVLPLVAVPVTAIWNGLVSYRVIREARVRAGGPAAVARSIEQLFGIAAPRSLRAHEAILRAVAATIVRTRDLHPNVLALFSEVRRHCSDVSAEDIDVPEEFLALVPKLEPSERDAALEALVVAATIDGRLTRRELQLLESAYAAAGLPARPADWRARLSDTLVA